MIACYDLIDLKMTDGKYTWSNNQNPPTLERLDRILVGKEWEDLFPMVRVQKMPREVSDHNPLILTTSSQQPLKNLSFRFELSWLKDDKFNSLVNEISSKPFHAATTFDRIQAKLKRIKQYFKGWGFNRQGVQKKTKIALQEELLSLENLEEIHDLDPNKNQRKVEIH